MKKLIAFVTLIVLLMLVVSCAGTPTEAPTEAPPEAQPEEDPFLVGLLSPGPVNDSGWNQVAYDSLLAMEEELGAQISYVELEESPTSFEKAFRDYASQGYDLVLGHGFQFQDAALIVGAEYPDTIFLISSSDVHEDNVVGVNIAYNEPFYLLGLIAAEMGNGAGIVGGVEIPPIADSFVGYVNGAKSVAPDFPVSTTYLGSWTDVAAAKEAALSQVAEGADFLAPNANIAGQGVHQAAVEAGVWSFGTSYDQTDLAPKNIVANYISDMSAGLVLVAADVQNGTFERGVNILFGVADSNVIWISYNEGSDNVVPDDVRQAVEAAMEAIIKGEINAAAPIEP